MRLCDAARSQLLLIDLQTRLFNAMPEPERAATIRAATILTQAAQALAIPVLATEQYPKGLGPTDPAVAGHLTDGNRCFEKTGFSCCSADGFVQALSTAQRRQIILVGQETHVCVLQTAAQLLARGYEVFVVEDGVCSRNPEHKRSALARMASAGVVVTLVESVLFEWLADASHPQFKTLSALIR